VVRSCFGRSTEVRVKRDWELTWEPRQFVEGLVMIVWEAEWLWESSLRLCSRVLRIVLSLEF
jgi:hypothetical protein